MAGYFSSSVYSDGANKNRGAKYSYYKVTLQQDFPSILVETGFVSNEEDAYALNNPTHQRNIAASIIKGIKSYIGKSNLSYSSNGSDTVSTFPEQDPGDDTTTTTTENSPVTTESTITSSSTTASESTTVSEITAGTTAEETQATPSAEETSPTDSPTGTPAPETPKPHESVVVTHAA